MEIADIESEFDDLKSYVNEIDSEDLESRITELEDKDLESRITELEHKITNIVQVMDFMVLEDKKYEDLKK